MFGAFPVSEFLLVLKNLTLLAWFVPPEKNHNTCCFILLLERKFLFFHIKIAYDVRCAMSLAKAELEVQDHSLKLLKSCLGHIL